MKWIWFDKYTHTQQTRYTRASIGKSSNANLYRCDLNQKKKWPSFIYIYTSFYLIIIIMLLKFFFHLKQNPWFIYFVPWSIPAFPIECKWKRCSNKIISPSISNIIWKKNIYRRQLKSVFQFIVLNINLKM